MTLAYLPYMFCVLIEIILASVIAIGWWAVYNRRIRQAGPILLLIGAVIQFFGLLGHLLQYGALVFSAYTTGWYRAFTYWSSIALWSLAFLAAICSLIGAALVVFRTKGRLWERASEYRSEERGARSE